MKTTERAGRMARILTVAIALGWALQVGAAATDSSDIPKLRVPRLKTPPTLDGKIEPGEWQGAAGISALASACPVGGATPTIAPPIQQVSFYMGYDDRYFYLAMRSPHKEGTYPQARCKQDDDMAVLFEDHIEFQINKHTRAQAKTPGFGFYKMMVNPRGAMLDQWLLNGTVGSEDLWSTGGETMCTVTPTYWDLEMSIEIAQMGLQTLDARSLVMWLCRSDFCNGTYFLTWGPGTWMAWDAMPEVTFDPDAPAVQLVGVGNVMEGNPDVVFNLSDTTGKARTFKGSLKIMNKAGQTICDETATTELPASGKATLRMAKTGVPIDEAGNTFIIEMKSGDTVYYYDHLPLARMTEAYRKNILESWLKGRPQSGDWDYKFAYRAGDGLAECSVDLDFFGIAEKVLKADACEVEILTAGGKSLAKDRMPIAGKTGSMVLKASVLPAGDYKARFTLLEGRKAIEQKELAFVRKTFAWETERLGISDEVVPPYEPIKVTTNKSSGQPVLGVWNRQYAIGANGLPENIRGGSVNLLRTPIRVEVDGIATPVKPADKPAEVIKAAGHATTVKGSQILGNVTLNTVATMEYDGWYDVTVEVSDVSVQVSGKPETRNLKPETISSLDLVLDLPAEFDTLYVHRNNDSFVGSYYGGIPAGTGTVWASTSLATFRDRHIPAKDWKSFAPVAFVGTGSRGLWFYAWSDKGWQLADGVAALRIERDAQGAPTLRVRMIAGGVTLDKPRKIRFALLAAPVKPLPEDYRNWKMSHDTSGYRYYGDSVDGYALPNDEAYEMERKRLLYGPQTDLARAARKHNLAIGRGLFNNRPVVLYGSTTLTGVGMEEFDTFGGEWLGRSNWKGNVERNFMGKPNYSGSVVWDNERKCTVVSTQFTPSYIDCFVWYHKKLIEKGVNGTWFDNCSIGLIKQLDPETGKLDTVFNQLARRELMKRLTTVNWQLMRRPCWLTNMHEDFSFSDVIWLVENEWYINGEGRDMLDHMSLDTFRAMACTKTMQLVARPWIRPGTPKEHPAYAHVMRSITGVLMAHDVQNFGIGGYQNLYDIALGRYLNFHVNFDNGNACKFSGYWDVPVTQVDPGDPEVKCSVYYNARRKTAVLWFLNTGKADKTLKGVTFSSDLMGRNSDCKVAFDAENGAPLKFAAAAEPKKVKAFTLTDGLVVKAHEFRAIAVGAEE